MSKRFPRARVERAYVIHAYHALPSPYAPGPEVHEHRYEITVAYHHERNGYATWDRAELDERVMPIIKLCEYANLNEVCGEPASDEVLASWLIKQMPGWVDEIQIYRVTPEERGYAARTIVRRRDIE